MESTMAYCMLCNCPSEDFMNLYDEAGNTNDAYDIVGRYFSSMVNIYEEKF